MSSPSSTGTSSIVTFATGAATRDPKTEGSNSVIARVPLQPRLTCSQKRSRPTPNGDTAPMPVMTTRGGRDSDMVHIVSGHLVIWSSGHLVIWLFGHLIWLIGALVHHCIDESTGSWNDQLR